MANFREMLDKVLDENRESRDNIQNPIREQREENRSQNVDTRRKVSDHDDRLSVLEDEVGIPLPASIVHTGGVQFASIGDIYDGELWVQGQHFYDSANFSPDNENGTAITGTYAGAVWVQINLSAMTVSYSATGPAGATFGSNITWRRLSECGGSGKYILC